MKKIFMTIVAVAAIAACSKTEVQYENSAEIGFAPAVKNVTKGAISGTYPATQDLMVFANYGTSAAETVVNDASSFSTTFLSNARFENKTVSYTDKNGTTTDVTAWGGGYAWPNTGSLIFAGYAAPKVGSVGNQQEYNFSSDKLTITDYVQSTNTAETFDLAWFNRTAKSYNYVSSPNNTVEVTLSHALSWIQIYVKGEGSTIDSTNPWTIKSITMNNVSNKGTVECTGAGLDKATWKNRGNTKKEVDGNQVDDNSIVIFSGAQKLLGEEKLCETNTGGTLVIPQKPTPTNDANPVATLTVVYTYKTQAGVDMPDQSVTLPLVVDGGWKSGYKYVYTLTFKSAEILITPSYDGWDTTVNQGVTIE